jgi:hypothetical protein
MATLWLALQGLTLGAAKDITLRPIDAAAANELVDRIHYSGSHVRNSQLHVGVFYRGSLEGALQFGPSTDKRKLIGLVEGTPWNGFIELNRMAFSERLPRNSESRAIAIAMRLLRRHKPALQWVVSFADACRCGDGTIYRASGFVLTGIRRSVGFCRLPDGRVIHKITLQSNPMTRRAELGGKTFFDVTGGKYSFGKYVQASGGEAVPGWQLRYLYFLDPAARGRLTVPLIPFSEIARRGLRMYRGERLRAGGGTGDMPDVQSGEAGSIPSPALESSDVQT